MRNRRFKSIGFLILFALCAVSLTGCGSSTVSTTTAAQTRQESNNSATSKNAENAKPPTEAPTQTPTEAFTEPPTTAVEPQIVDSYTLDKLLTNFADGCALARCQTESDWFIALIDKDGYILWRDTWDEFKECDYYANHYGMYIIEKHKDRVWSYIYLEEPKLLILDNNGAIIFDSRTQSEEYRYYYYGFLGEYGPFVVERYTDFSSDKWNLRRINPEGIIKDLPGFEHFRYGRGSRLVYWGNDLFTYYVEDNNKGTYIYNAKTEKTITVGEGSYSIYAPYIFSWILFSDDRVLFRFEEISRSRYSTTTIVDPEAKPYYFYNVPKNAFENENDFKRVFENLSDYQVGKLAYIDRYEIENGLINYRYDGSNPSFSDKSGVYSINGEPLGLYPDNWDITDLSTFNEDGFAYVFLKGADGSEWFTVVDSTAKPQFDPIKRTDGNFNKIEAQYDILWDEEEQPVPYIVKKMEEGDKVNLYEVSNYQELKEAGIIIGEPTPAQQPSQSPDSRTYTYIKGFSISGTWKNTGSYTYGQAQSGAIIVFDGSRCNFFSPSDTYAFYAEGDHYRLDCTSPLGDTVSFIVRIVDENHIDIFNGQNIVELTKIVQ